MACRDLLEGRQGIGLKIALAVLLGVLGCVCTDFRRYALDGHRWIMLAAISKFAVKDPRLPSALMGAEPVAEDRCAAPIRVMRNPVDVRHMRRNSTSRPFLGTKIIRLSFPHLTLPFFSNCASHCLCLRFFGFDWSLR